MDLQFLLGLVYLPHQVSKCKQIQCCIAFPRGKSKHCSVTIEVIIASPV